LHFKVIFIEAFFVANVEIAADVQINSAIPEWQQCYPWVAGGGTSQASDFCSVYSDFITTVKRVWAQNDIRL